MLKIVIGKSERALAVISTLFGVILILNMIVLIILSAIDERETFIFSNSVNLMILAAHQDDEVIMAGGLAIQNCANGGTIHIVYLTREKDHDLALTREQEARTAWKLINCPNISLTFLDFVSERLWDDVKISMAIDTIHTLIKQVNPDILIVPLLENGHYEHDLLNVISKRAIPANLVGLRVWQAAEYNPYFLASYSPGKVLWFLVRLLPYVPYLEPNYGLIPSNQKMIELSEEQLANKIAMLKAFKTQAGVITISQFGYSDIFETTPHPPQNLITLAGKRFDLWAIISLFIAFVFFFSIGMWLAIRWPKQIAILAIAIGVFMTVNNFRLGSRFILEEGLYVVAYLTGSFASFLLLFITYMLYCVKTTDRA